MAIYSQENACGNFVNGRLLTGIDRKRDKGNFKKKYWKGPQSC